MRTLTRSFAVAAIAAACLVVAAPAQAGNAPLNILPPAAKVVAIPAIGAGAGWLVAHQVATNHWTVIGHNAIAASAPAATGAAIGFVGGVAVLVGYDWACKTAGYDFFDLRLGNRCSWRQ